MARFHIINTQKRELTEKEEKQRILSNLRRFSKISMFEHNEQMESFVNIFNVQVCGIDKSGKEKMMNDSTYSKSQRAFVSEFGIQECRRRNYAVIRKAIKTLLPIDNQTFSNYMPYHEFLLCGVRGTIYWGADKLSNEYDEYGNYIQDEKLDDWSLLNSVDICYNILSIIRRKMMLDKLKGNFE